MARIINYGSIDWKPKVAEQTATPDPPLVSEEKRREIMDRERVWVADPVEGFIRGNIVDFGEEEVTVEPVERRPRVASSRPPSTGCTRPRMTTPRLWTTIAASCTSTRPPS